jgi:hypothetical protein
VIKPVPTWYRGTRFASTLEADWACTFDAMGWEWEYEPEALLLSTGEYYRPDFYLKGQRVWCEVKGPHNERVHKPRQLHKDLNWDEVDEWSWHARLVVILRAPGPGEAATWDKATDEGQDIVVVRCPDCEHYCFMDFNGVWTCRRHFNVGKESRKFWLEPGGQINWPGDLKFERVPRRTPKGAA